MSLVWVLMEFSIKFRAAPSSLLIIPVRERNLKISHIITRFRQFIFGIFHMGLLLRVLSIWKINLLEDSSVLKRNVRNFIRKDADI